MSIRRVRGVSRGAPAGGPPSSRFIRGLCNPAEAWGYRDLGDVVIDIENGAHAYLVEADGSQATVRVVHSPGGPYLRTDPDPTRANNLDALPDCASLNGQGPGPRRVRARRNIATIGARERRRLRDAILELNRRYYTVNGQRDAVSIWLKQDQIHQATHVHQQASFLAWHRKLVNEFERQLQEIDPTLALHYWDWTTDPRHSPDGRGGFVDLMTAEFLGGGRGAVGSPLLEADFYRPSPPNRYINGDGRPRQAPFPPNLPPGTIERKVLDGPPQVKPDRDIAGVSGRPGVEFERFWRALIVAHAIIHRSYLGGTLGPDHMSFEDPWVFLLHSNVDRLWASWQLRLDGVDHSRETSWRLDPDYIYGQLIEGRVEAALLDPPDIQPPQGVSWDDFLEQLRRKQGGEAVRELTTIMRPWDGAPAGTNQPPPLFPWIAQPERLTPQSPEILRPPLYDRYVFDGQLCMSWTTLLLGRELPRGDVIQLTVELDTVPASEVEFVLNLGPNPFWWKGLRLSDGTMLEVQNATRTATARVPVDQVRAGSELVFHKLVRLFLFATGRRIVYRLGDLTWIPSGSRLTFSWDQD